MAINPGISKQLSDQNIRSSYNVTDHILVSGNEHVLRAVLPRILSKLSLVLPRIMCMRPAIRIYLPPTLAYPNLHLTRRLCVRVSVLSELALALALALTRFGIPLMAHASS